MKHRRILWVLALAAGALVAFVVWPRGPKEPEYQGKPLSFWLNASLANGAEPRPGPRHVALNAIGTNALPWLMAELTRKDSRWRSAVNLWLARNTFLDSRLTRDQERVRLATTGIFLLGTNAVPCLPALAGLLAEPQRSAWVAWAMAGCGEAALSHLLAATASTNPLVRVSAIGGITTLARDSDSAIPRLLGLLSHPDPWSRRITAIHLTYVDRRPDLVLPEVVKLVSFGDPQVRESFTNRLHRLDGHSRPALPALLQLLTNSDPAIAWAASNAVQRIDPAALPPPGPAPR